MYKIPPELIRMISKRKVIPFIGAGFSKPANLPDWKGLIEKIAYEQEQQCFCQKDNPVNVKVPYDKVRQSCLDDHLRIAEYYYIKNEKNIGPIRHSLSRQLINEYNPLHSGAHVELVNLGAQQIYTTNYDDLIENTYKKLNLPYQVVALPMHIAVATDNKTQIVKYHGDLRYEKTLMLTESSYFSRLDFESPMDLKFRSDILGRSVLFIGYSFSDINIRLLWFRLMQMMKDLKGSKSYIVRLEPDPVLETLYEASGIQTIVLDPEGKTTDEDKSELLADFMHELARQANSDGIIPCSVFEMNSSQALLKRVERDCNIAQEDKDNAVKYNFESLITASKRKILEEHKNRLAEILGDISEDPNLVSNSEDLLNFAIWYAKEYGSNTWVASVIAGGLTKEATRENILKTDVPWKNLLGEKISNQCADSLLHRFQGEIALFKLNLINEEDVPYLFDLAFRIKHGYLVEPEQTSLISLAEHLCNEFGQIYNEANNYSVSIDEKPNLDLIIKQMIESKTKFESK